MHIVRYVFITKIYDGSSHRVALSRFDFFNCQAATTLRYFFSFSVGGSRLGARIWARFMWGPVSLLAKNNCNVLKGWKNAKGSSRLRPSLQLELYCHPLKVSCHWKNQWALNSFKYNDSTELRLALTAVQLLHKAPHQIHCVSYWHLYFNSALDV